MGGFVGLVVGNGVGLWVGWGEGFCDGQLVLGVVDGISLGFSDGLVLRALESSVGDMVGGEILGSTSYAEDDDDSEGRDDTEDS